jgi:lipopolysaccharide/colanic/teichoic acid biosynthesis glycosyltransferase
MVKRLFDLSAALVGVVILAPLFAVIAVLILLDTGRPVLFRQHRVGRHFVPFRVLKFRTMVVNARALGRPITAGDDPRITRVGRWLRRTKLDELPQLWNVIRGEMSLVGPRPELFEYVEMFHRDYEEILKVRPGITDYASLLYRDESELLAKADDPEREYTGRVLPDKLRLSADYLRRSSFFSDLKLIVRTVIGSRLGKRT